MDSVVLKNVSYKYPTSEENVLDNVSLEIKKGEFCSIIGSNGSGKTTLCSVIRGFVPKFYKGDLQGEILINGRLYRIGYGDGSGAQKMMDEIKAVME